MIDFVWSMSGAGRKKLPVSVPPSPSKPSPVTIADWSHAMLAPGCSVWSLQLSRRVFSADKIHCSDTNVPGVVTAVAPGKCG